MKEKILIVEDETNMRTILTMELEGAGYQVFQAEDGEAGFQIAMSVKPDLIISDILMPNLDGNQLRKKLRESEFGKHIPFIVLTARGQMQDYFEMMEVDDFIPKPFEAEDLLTRIARVFEKKKKGHADSAAESDPDSKKKVLILDDDSELFEKFEKLLTENNYEVTLVKTVPECLNTASIFRPHMLALRFMLDGMGGQELVETVMAAPYTKGVPFLVYSRELREEEGQGILDAGASHFVGEVDENKILEAVKETIG